MRMVLGAVVACLLLANTADAGRFFGRGGS